MCMFLKEKLEEFLIGVRQGIARELDRHKEKVDLYDTAWIKKALERQSDIGKKAYYLLATGNIISSTGLDLQQAAGYTIVAEKLNHWRYLSHFRSVHRGQFFTEMKRYCHRLSWVDDFKATGDQILKFAANVPDARTDFFYDLFRRELDGLVEPTTSGHGSIDLITPGCHKASGLARLVNRWGISPEQCVAFGDGGNDVEMLRFCGIGYAMDNAPDDVKAAANRVCPSNDEDGVLVALDELFA